MGFVSCPSCDEQVRLPSTDLPDDVSAQCPWCGHTHLMDRWVGGLPPKVLLLDSEGKSVPWPTEPSTVDHSLSDYHAGESIAKDSDQAIGQEVTPEAETTEEPLEAPVVSEIQEPTLPRKQHVQSTSVEMHVTEEDSISEIDAPSLMMTPALESTDELDQQDSLDSIITPFEPLNQEEIESYESEDDLDLDISAEDEFGLDPIDSASTYDEEQEFDSEISQEEQLESEDHPDDRDESMGSLELDDPYPVEEASSDSPDVSDEPDLNVEAIDDDDSEPDASNEWQPSLETGVLEFSDEEAQESAESTTELEPRDSGSAKPKVPLATDQRSYYRRHQWGGRRSIKRRLTRVAIPAVLTMCAVGAAVLLSGMAPDIGVFPLDGSFNEKSPTQASVISSEFSGNSDQSTSLKPGIEDIGTSAAELTPENPSSENLSSENPSSENPSSDGIDRVESDTVGSDPSSINDDRFEMANELSKKADDARSSRYGSDSNPIEEIDAWIEDAIEESKTQPPPENETGTSPLAEIMRKRAEMVARERKTLEAPDIQRNNLNNSLLVFPRDAPDLAEIKEGSGISEDSMESQDVRQASAVSEIGILGNRKVPESSGELPRLPRPDSNVPPNPVDFAPNDASLAANLIDSAELIAACEQAIKSLDELNELSRRSDSSRELELTLVRAYRDVARVGEIPSDTSSPSVALLLTKLARMQSLQPFESLPVDWLRFSNRPTDGILLVGQLKGDGQTGMFELPNGVRYNVRYQRTGAVPQGNYVVAIGRVIQESDTPLIELVAGEVVE